jgi:hypothetical protein
MVLYMASSFSSGRLGDAELDQATDVKHVHMAAAFSSENRAKQ